MWGTVSIFCLVLIGIVYTDNNSKCQVKDIADKEWIKNLELFFNDNQINEIVFESEYSGTINNLTCRITAQFKQNYLDFSTNDTHFIVKTTDLLKDYDEDVLNLDKPVNYGIYICYMTCQDATAPSDLEVWSTISDYNNHSPVFSKGNTTYVVSSPIMAKTDFTFFGDRISATDLDFSNKNIAFKTDPDHFEVTSSEDTSTIPSTFTATFRAKKILYISEPVTYKIIATDSGTLPGPNSTPLDVTLVLDEDNNVIFPVFDSSSYIYQYNSDNTLSLLSGPIKFQLDVDNPEFELFGELKDHFSVSYDPSTSQVSLKLETNIDDPSTSYTNLILSYKAGVDEKTSIIIYFSTAPTEENVKFKQTLYTGTYDDTTGEGTVKLDQNIEVTITGSTGEPTVYISKGTDFDAKTYFSLTKVTDHYEVTVEQVLTDEILKQQKSLVITIEADLDTTKTYATLVINLPVQKYLEFDKVLYSGTYDTTNEDKKFSVDDIKITTNIPNEVDVSITSDYKEYFTAAYSTSTSSVTISNTEIPDDKLQGVTSITILLTATLNEGTIAASSVVNINIIKDDTEADSLEFDKVLYDGTYESKNKIVTVSFDEIKINTNKPDEVFVYVKTLEKYFSVSYDPTKSVVTITKEADLPEDQLTNTVIPIVLLASFSSVSASAVVNLKIINDDTDPDGKTGYILFDTLSYSAEYSVVDNKGVLQMDNKITITTDQDNSKINTSITDDLELYPTYIGSSYSDKEFIVILEQNLPDTVLSKSFVTLTLSASIRDNPTQKTSAVLTIKINNDNLGKSLEFENTLYEGQYEIKDSEGTLTLDSMKIITAEPNDVEVSLDDTYKAYFNPTYDSATATVKLTKTGNLPDDLLKGKSVVSPILTASLKDSKVTASAVINLEIVNDDNLEKSLEFENTLYEGQYEIKDSDGTLTLDSMKIITAEPNDVEVSLDDTYKAYLNPTYDSATATVKLTKTGNLPDDLLKGKSVVSPILTASLKDSKVTASAVINLEIVNDDNLEKSLEFENTLYEGQYEIKDSEGILTLDSMKIITVEPNDVEVSLDDTYKAYFNPTYDSATATVKLTKAGNLPDDLLKGKSVVSPILTASLKDSKVTASAVINLAIVNDDLDPSTGHISFSSPVYAAVYEIKDNVASISSIDVISIDTDQEDKDVLVTIQNGKDSYFNADYANKKVTMSLKSTTASENLRNQSNIPVVLLAQISGTTDSDKTTVVNFKVVDDDSGDTDNTSTVSFSRLVYEGHCTYELDHKIDLEVDKVYLVTDRPESEIIVSLDNEYDFDQYFEVSYSHTEVTVSLKTAIPEEVFKENSYITLTMTAAVENYDSIRSQAILNINLTRKDKGLDEEDVTKYIVAISILVIFIVLLVAAAVVFYYLRLRNLKYNKMTEEEYINSHASGKVRFDKSALRHSVENKPKRSSLLEERRPTGFIFNPKVDLEDESRESTTDPPEILTKERKKSVAFDANVEKLQIDPVNDDETEKGTDEITDLNNSD